MTALTSATVPPSETSYISRDDCFAALCLVQSVQVEHYPQKNNFYYSIFERIKIEGGVKNFRTPQREHPMFTRVSARWAGNLPTGKAGAAVRRSTVSRGGRGEVMCKT